MGCIILMAVRHRDLDKVAALDPKDFDLCYNQSDYNAKYFDRGTALIAADSNPNVLISHFYESTTSAVLVVNGDFLLRPEEMVLCHALGEKGVEDLLPTINLAIKRDREHYAPVEGLTRPEMTGDKVSIFALDLDTFNKFERNPHAMADIALYCQTGSEQPSRTFGHGVTVIGTVEGNQSLLVLMDRWWIKAAAIPRYEMRFSAEEQDQLTNFPITHRGLLQRTKLFQGVFMREFMAGFGYARAAIPTKTRKAKQTAETGGQ